MQLGIIKPQYETVSTILIDMPLTSHKVCAHISPLKFPFHFSLAQISGYMYVKGLPGNVTIAPLILSFSISLLRTTRMLRGCAYLGQQNPLVGKLIG